MEHLSRLVSRWYSTSITRIVLWVAGLAFAAYLLNSLGEFVGGAAKAVSP